MDQANIFSSSYSSCTMRSLEVSIAIASAMKAPKVTSMEAIGTSGVSFVCRKS